MVCHLVEIWCINMSRYMHNGESLCRDMVCDCVTMSRYHGVSLCRDMEYYYVDIHSSIIKLFSWKQSQNGKKHMQ